MNSDKYLSYFPRGVHPGVWFLEQDLLASLSLYGIFTTMVVLVGIISFTNPVFNMNYSTWWSCVLLMIICYFLVFTASPIPDLPRVITLYVVALLLYCTFVSRIYVHSRAMYLCILGVIIGAVLLSEEVVRANISGPPRTPNEVTERYLLAKLRQEQDNDIISNEETISCSNIENSINAKHLVKLLSFYDCRADPNANNACERVYGPKLSPLTKLGFDPTDEESKNEALGFLTTCTQTKETEILKNAIMDLKGRPSIFTHALTDPRRYFVYDSELVTIDNEYSGNSLFWSTYTNTDRTGWFLAVFEGCMAVINYSFMFLFIALPLID